MRKLKEKIELEAWSHVQSLSVQGALLKSLSASLGASIIKKWTCHVSTMTSPMFKFVRKAIQQQLPTAANLKRWGKQYDPSCPLCKNIQSNKHVLSNCSSAVVLERYRSRHDRVLEILADWISFARKADLSLHADLGSGKYGRVSDIFHTLRPDIVLVGMNSIFILELTICHETNLERSRQFKMNKYSLLPDCLNAKYINYKMFLFTIEVTTLGLISDFAIFINSCLIERLSDSLRMKIANSVISDSYSIYCNRNNNIAP